VSFLKAIRAVLWSFLGIRKRSGLEDDVQNLSPFYLIGVGIALCLVFVFSLVFLVHWAVKI
jgi:hypothetical protein